jgi:two-component system cell cycle response regulator
VTRKSKSERSSGYTLLLTDDNLDYLQVTGRLLEREGHTVLTASSGAEALEILRTTKVDLLLLDYYMPGMTGEEVVTELRKWNPFVQVILQTGYASEQPPRTLLRRLDIQGYYDKSEGPDKLLLWTEVGLKSAYVIQLLNKSRQGLRYILDVTPDMHKIQSLADLLQGILLQVSGLLGASNSFLALLPEGGAVRGSAEAPGSFLAMMEEDNELMIRASTGSFEGNVRVETYLSDTKLHLVRRAVGDGQIQIEQGATVVPLRVSESTLGIIFLDRAAVHQQDIELLNVFANQAAVAIQNAQLYEMATLDQLTGAYLRRFFEQWMLRELRTAWRSQQVISLLLVDVDGMKSINDSGGHLAGDQALSLVGGSLREAVRTSDVVGRYGGDEFAVVLPQTSTAGAERVAERILQLVRDTTVGDANLPVKLSIGIAVLEAPLPLSGEAVRSVSQKYFEGAAKALFQRADEALYEAKRSGGARFAQAASLTWQDVPPVEAGAESAWPSVPPRRRSQTPGS